MRKGEKGRKGGRGMGGKGRERGLIERGSVLLRRKRVVRVMERGRGGKGVMGKGRGEKGCWN